MRAHLLLNLKKKKFFFQLKFTIFPQARLPEEPPFPAQQEPEGREAAHQDAAREESVQARHYVR